MSVREREELLQQECADDPELAADLMEIVQEELVDERFLHPFDGVPDGAERPDRIGPYELLEKIGDGGMGAVWLARREGDFEQRVAITHDALEFLEDVLQAPDPKGGGSRDIRMVDALDLAVERAGEIPNPVTRVAVYSTLARVYHGLGEHETAEAVAIECRRFGQVVPRVDLVSVTNALGLIARESGRRAEAVSLFEEALSRLDDSESGYLTQDEDLTDWRLTILMNLASAVEDEEPLRAEQILNQLIRLRSERSGPDHQEVQLIRFNLGGILFEQGHVERAMMLLTEAHEELVHHSGEESFMAIGAAAGVGVGLIVSGRAEQARLLLERYAEIAARVLGPEHQWTLITEMSLAWALLELGRIEESEALATRIGDSTLIDPEDVLTRERVLAACWLRTGREAEAEAALRATLEEWRRVDPSAVVDRAMLLHELASCLERLDRPEEAHESAAEAITLLEGLPGRGFAIHEKLLEMEQRLRRP